MGGLCSQRNVRPGLVPQPQVDGFVEFDQRIAEYFQRHGLDSAAHGPHAKGDRLRGEGGVICPAARRTRRGVADLHCDRNPQVGARQLHVHGVCVRAARGSFSGAAGSGGELHADGFVVLDADQVIGLCTKDAAAAQAGEVDAEALGAFPQNIIEQADAEHLCGPVEGARGEGGCATGEGGVVRAAGGCAAARITQGDSDI